MILQAYALVWEFFLLLQQEVVSSLMECFYAFRCVCSTPFINYQKQQPFYTVTYSKHSRMTARGSARLSDQFADEGV